MGYEDKFNVVKTNTIQSVIFRSHPMQKNPDNRKVWDLDPKNSKNLGKNPKTFKKFRIILKNPENLGFSLLGVKNPKFLKFKIWDPKESHS